MRAAAPASTIDRAERISLADHAPHAVNGLLRFQSSIKFDPALGQLVAARASMLNGRVKESVSANAIRSRSSNNGLSCQEEPLDGEVYARAAEEFGADDLAELVAAIAAINTWNRVVIASGTEYDPDNPRGG